MFRSRQGRGGGVVGVAGWRCEYEGMSGSGAGLGAPAWGFFGVVAGFAEPCSVAAAGGAAVVPGDDVVQVADGGVAVGGAAGVVPCLEEPAVSGREEPGPGVHAHEFAGGRGGVEPAQPDGEGLLAVRAGSGVVAGVVDKGTCPPGGDDAVAGEPGGFAVALEQG